MSQLPFELAALRAAVNYQRWVAAAVAPHLGSRILEVGAGLGSMSRWLPLRERLVLSELEPALLELLAGEMRERFGADPRVAVMAADLSGDLPASLKAENFDTAVSFNVIEHLEQDAATLAALAGLLRASSFPGPRRIVSFVPAHQWAYGAMDRHYGHFRRYTAASFAALAARACPDFRLETRYFNVFGLPGWVFYGRLLQRSTVDLGAIRLFERLCPWFRPLDEVLHRLGLPLGQSLIAVLTLQETRTA